MSSVKAFLILKNVTRKKNVTREKVSFRMIVNEIKKGHMSTNLKYSIVQPLAFKKCPLVHKIQLEDMIITPCSSD